MMGQKQSNNKNDSNLAKKSKLQELDDSDDEIERVDEEAQPYIVATFRYKKETGEIEEAKLRIITSTTKAKTVKKKIAQKFNISEETVQVFLENREVELPDMSTFFELGITDNITLIVRDGS